jgi:hypothetical protein
MAVMTKKQQQWHGCIACLKDFEAIASMVTKYIASSIVAVLVVATS